MFLQGAVRFLTHLHFRVLPWLALSALLFGGGFYAAEKWFPRIVTVQVDKEILKVVDRILPGQTIVVTREVPGPTQVIKIPVEVIKLVPKEGPVRIVTITKPVDVLVEVVKEKWPQVITITVGGVESGGSWYAPDHPELLIGQVTPGVYAFPNQPGWRVEQVKTETKLTPEVAGPRPLPHFQVQVGGLVTRDYGSFGPRLQYENWLNRVFTYQAAVRYDALVVNGHPGLAFELWLGVGR